MLESGLRPCVRLPNFLSVVAGTFIESGAKELMSKIVNKSHKGLVISVREKRQAMNASKYFLEESWQLRGQENKRFESSSTV